MKVPLAAKEQRKPLGRKTGKNKKEKTTKVKIIPEEKNYKSKRKLRKKKTTKA